MDLELVRMAYNYIQKYAPTKEMQDIVVRQTVHFCSTFFPSVEKDTIQHAAREAWKQHILSSKNKSLESSNFTFSYSLKKDLFPRNVESTDHESMEDTNERRIIELRESYKQRNELPELLKPLNAREKAIVELRFGLTNGYFYTQEEVGKVFGVTRHRVSHIEERAFHKMKLFH
jgi:RNA polymerase primary sigma factor